MFKKTLITSVIALGLPIASFAATPQQILNNLPTQTSLQSQAVQGVINLTVKSKDNVKNAKVEQADLSFSLNQRVLPKSATEFETEGRLALTKLASKELPFTLNEPISVQWKWVNKHIYFRIEQVPSALVDYARGAQIPLNDVVGRWFTLDDSFMQSFEKLGGLDTSTVLPTDLQKLSKERPFLAVRVDKKWKDANGDDQIRIRARLNPSFINKLQAAEVAALDKKSPFYKDELKTLRASQLKTATLLRNMNFVIGINTTKNELNRVELAGSQTIPTQSCTFNTKTKRDVCKLVSTQYVSFNAGFSFLKDSGTAIVAPDMPTNFFEFLGTLSQQLTSSSTNGLLQEDMSQTLTNTGTQQ